MQKNFIRILAGIAAAALFVPACCIYAADSESGSSKQVMASDQEETGEDSDYTMRTENEVLRTMKKACENKNYILFYSEEEDLIALENKKNGYVWWSSPVNAEGDPNAKGSVKKELESSLIVVYGDPDERTGSTLRSAKNGKMKYSVKGNTLEVTYRFPSAGFVLPVKYTLDEKSLNVHADTADFQENKREEGENMILLEISVLPNMLAAGSHENGYYIIPDGSGAKINFNNGKTNARAYSAKVYGNDITAVSQYQPDISEQIYLPVYASVKDSGNAMLAVIHEGDSSVLIQSSVSGLSKSSYNTCNSRFILRNTDTYYMNSEPLTVFEDGEPGLDSLEIRFYPVYDRPVGCADIAEVYRQYLTDVKGVNAVKDTLPLCVSLYGGAEKKEPFLGVPVTRKKSFTSFREAEETVRNLYDSGADNMIVTMENWTDDGISGRVDYSAKPSSVLGSSQDFKNMISYFDEKKVRFYPVVNNTTFSSGGGYWTFSDTAMRASGQYSRQISYNAAYGTRDGTKKAESLLSPAVYPELFGKISAGFQKRGLTGICPGDITSVLYGDYGKKHKGRNAAEQYITEGLASFRSEIGSVMSKGANAYAFGYTDYISDVPLCSSGYDIFDGDIPFMQMVLHGLIPYSSESVNKSADPELQVLMAAASGSGISFDMISGEISELKDTEYDVFYYADSSFWSGTAAAEYRFIKDVLSGAAGAYMTDYSSDGNAATAVYSNGTVINVDFENGYADIEGKKFVLADYLEKYGGEIS